MISLGADVCHKDADEAPPILKASSFGCVESVMICIEDGAELNVQSYIYDGNTPLHEATYGYPEIINILYDNGALLKIKNDDGETPMELGLKNNELESIKAFAFLLH